MRIVFNARTRVLTIDSRIPNRSNVPALEEA